MAQAAAVTGSKHDITSILKHQITRSTNGVISLAPGIARRILDECKFHGQRQCKPFRANEHLMRINKGTWNDQFPITFAHLPDGQLWLVDGQHRCDAISQAGRTVGVRINVMEAATEYEARRIYAGFDRPEQNRTHNEMLDGLDAYDSTGLKRDTVRCLFRALPLILNNMEIARSNQLKSAHARSVETRIDMLSSWVKEATAYEQIVQQAEPALKRPLYGSAVMAVALYTFRHQPARAREFWSGVCGLADDLHKDDPRQRLMWDLLNRNLSSGHVRQGVQMASIAWSKWFNGDRIKMIKCHEGSPIVILGTPLAKGNK